MKIPLLALVLLLVAGPAFGPTSLAPARVADLRVSAVTDSTAVLTWTEVSTAGTGVARYAVRFGRVADFTWTAASDVVTGGCAAPVYGSTAGGGRTRSCVLGGLLANTGYKFQVVAYTGVLNSTAVFGPLSNVVADTTDGLRVRLGPLLISRAPILIDTVDVRAASISFFGDRRLPLAGRFPLGPQLVVGYDSTGAVVARGYLLVVRP